MLLIEVYRGWTTLGLSQLGAREGSIEEARPLLRKRQVTFFSWAGYWVFIVGWLEVCPAIDWNRAETTIWIHIQFIVIFLLWLLGLVWFLPLTIDRPRLFLGSSEWRSGTHDLNLTYMATSLLILLDLLRLVHCYTAEDLYIFIKFNHLASAPAWAVFRAIGSVRWWQLTFTGSFQASILRRRW